MRQREIAAVFTLLVCALLVVPALATALGSVTRVELTAQVEPNGEVLMTERRTIPDPRQVEFIELLVPSGTLSVTGVADQKGAFASDAAGAGNRTFHVETGGSAVYVEWRDTSPTGPQEITLTYRITGSMILHEDAVEWYWPGLTGSGGRDISRVDLTLKLPSSGQAYLYAYGGEAGGVRTQGDGLRVTARNIAADRTFEWRLLVPRSQLPNAMGSIGPSRLASLQRIELDRIDREMNRAQRLWLAHWFLLAGPVVVGAIYWLTVRRFPPNPDPGSLSESDLTAYPPAVVGWVYDAQWFDYACAQLIYLERHKAIQWEWRGERLAITRAPMVTVGPSDEKLLALFCISFEPITTEQIAEQWSKNPGGLTYRRGDWLDAVGKEVPSEWLRRPSMLWGIVIGVLYAAVGIYSLAVVQWLALWAIAALVGVMVWKRRWLSPLGESHIARWVAAYWGAVSPDANRRWPKPEVPAEYFLAVEVGDDPLRKLMGSERYRVVKIIYEDLE